LYQEIDYFNGNSTLRGKLIGGRTIVHGSENVHEWSEKPVEQMARERYDLLKWGATSGNSCPARFVWVRNSERKDKLAPFAMDSNRAKNPGAGHRDYRVRPCVPAYDAGIKSRTGRNDAISRVWHPQLKKDALQRS
jgi:nitroreductase